MSGGLDEHPKLANSREILQRALIWGEYEGAVALEKLEHLVDPVASHALSLALSFARYWTDDPRGELIQPHLIEPLIGQDPSIDAILDVLCAAGERAAVLGFDLTALTRWLHVHDNIPTRNEESALRAALARAWLELFGGRNGASESCFSDVKLAARNLGLADVLVEAEIGLSLTALEGGDRATAVGSARRASRMARTEEQPFQELFATLALARVRRTLGTPYLASRILSSLSSLAPTPWRGWILWEQFLTGASPSVGTLGPTPACRAATVLQQLLSQVCSGDRQAYELTSEVIVRELQGVRPALGELVDLLFCIDPDRVDGSDAARQWVMGTSNVAPHGFQGIVQHLDASELPPTVGYVVAEPGRAARRILGLGKHLMNPEETLLLERQHRPPERTHIALATLAFTNEQWIDEKTFFGQLYGFEYDYRLHKPILDSLIRRMRSKIEPWGDVSRRDAHLRLETSKRLVIWDPRCEHLLEDWLLSVLAQKGPQPARAAAARLGVPLRTVQAALRDLTESRACVSRKEGRRVLYAVEDTTFSDPTMSRFKHLG